MAQQKPGVMLYFEMRNVFEELSNEKKRNPAQRDSRLQRTRHPARFPRVTADCVGFHPATAGQGR